MTVPTLEEIISEIEFLDNWEDRYKYIIDLGKTSPPLKDSLKNDQNKVHGCASQVWFVKETKERNGETILYFKGDSDAFLVKGLVIILFSLFSGKSPHDILEIDPYKELRRLNLERNLTMQRSNGLFSMIKRIKEDAQILING
tara:strand:- start:56 stop:484 length:429 start_codon:yes stop_codon:yes gene_type:complete